MIKMKRKRMFLICFVFFLFFALGCLALYIFLGVNELMIVKKANYDVEVIGQPEVTGEVYNFGQQNRFLLVLIDEKNRVEGYYLGLDIGKIGDVDFFNTFKPIRRIGLALIDKKAALGYPTIGEIDIDIKKNDKKTELYVTDYSEQAKSYDPNKKGLLEKRLIYKRRIVLKDK